MHLKMKAAGLSIMPVNERFAPKNLDVVILCGGMGKRLKRMVSGIPKPMAEVTGRPFLDILLDYAVAFGFRRFILCAGYRGDKIKEYYRKRKGVVISQEKKPLGTAGAVKNAQRFIKSSPFLVMNGDSLCKLDLLKFINFYEEKNASFSMVLTKSKGGNDYGRVNINNSNRIINFDEKKETRRNDFINAGVYLLDINIFSIIPAGRKLSLEYDVFPEITEDRFYGYITEEELIDIGTPDRYLAAQQIASKSFYEKR